MRTIKRRLLLVPFVLLLVPSNAFAGSPWWHLNAGARPTYLHAGAGAPGANAVFKLVETGESSFYYLEEPVAAKNNPIEAPAPEANFVALHANANATEIKQGLEQIEAYGSGNVEVKEIASDEFTVEIRERAVSLAAEAGEPATVTQTATGAPHFPDGEIVLTAENLGDATVNGVVSPVKITDTLPPGLEAVGIIASKPVFGGNLVADAEVPCVLATLTCTMSEALVPDKQIEVRIAVNVLRGAKTGELNSAAVTGGGAKSAFLARPITISGAPVPFGAETYELENELEGGAPATQAGSHPFQSTTTITLNQLADTEPLENVDHRPRVPTAGLAKDLSFNWPAGLIGNPSAVPVCTSAQFNTNLQGAELINACPASTAVGVAAVTISSPGIASTATFTQPVFNLEPHSGEPARFGLIVEEAEAPVFIDTALRSDGDYGVTVSSFNITQIVGLLSAKVTIWGAPGDPRHDSSRGWGCLEATAGIADRGPCVASEETHPPAFLTLPTACSGPLASSVLGDSWNEPAASGMLPTLAGGAMPGLEGCNQVPFSPAISAEPTTDRASAPSGLDFNINFDDEGLLNQEGLAQSQLNKAVVTLPEGLTINPSAAVGLGGCRPADYARETLDSTPGGGCPNNSKLGTVEIETPLLAQKIHGSLFVAQPYENPFDSLVALYVVAKNPETGVLVKLAGKVTPDPVTGRLTTTFENTPQLAFDHFNFHFREGQQAPLSSPPTCGTYTTTAQLSPWSDPAASLTDTSQFTITKGFDGGACASAGFAPSFAAGSENPQAAGYSPFTLSLSRSDGDQELAGLSVTLPRGLLGKIAGIPLCPDANANAGTCPEASRVGTVQVGAGVGLDPLSVSGEVYLTGPYKGGPYGLVVEVPAVAGPFDLGVVAVRQSLRIDPHTAQVSDVSDPLPTILDGIPLRVRHVDVTLDRPGFTFNPTNCTPTAIAGTVTSTGGATADVSSRFQAGGCRELPFKPSFKVSTQAKTSKKQGASLDVRVTSGRGQANLARVAVSLPKQLPSRLTTIQQACPQATFAANPASCPGGSNIGTATATTPILSSVVSGPAYLVSHGGAAFPDLVVILQGEGVTLDLTGSIDIKHGVTSSTFASIPDAPIDTFELKLPEGPHSGLTAVLPAKAKGNLCGTSLTMPTTLTGQNGAQIKQSTKIAVTGCGKAKPKKKAKHTKKRGKKKGGKK